MTLARRWLLAGTVLLVASAIPNPLSSAWLPEGCTGCASGGFNIDSGEGFGTCMTAQVSLLQFLPGECDVDSNPCTTEEQWRVRYCFTLTRNTENCPDQICVTPPTPPYCWSTPNPISFKSGGTCSSPEWFYFDCGQVFAYTFKVGMEWWSFAFGCQGCTRPEEH